MTINVTRVSCKKRETIIKYTKDINGETDNLVLTSGEQPHADLVNAMQAIKPFFLQTLGLPEEYGEGMIISGISFTHNEHQGDGCVITAQKKIPNCNAPLILNTPHLTAANGEGEEGVNCNMTSDDLDLLNAIRAEGEEFVGGKRAPAAQGSLFGDDEEA